MDRCARWTLAEVFLVPWDANWVPGPSSFAAPLAHWAHAENRIARYQMLCRVGSEPERAFVLPRLSMFFRFPSSTFLPNLFLAGAGVFGDGVPPCMQSGQVAAKMVERALSKS